MTALGKKSFLSRKVAQPRSSSNYSTLKGASVLLVEDNEINQEIGREINTIGSKANDADMQKVVVQMKDELEKIKEQVLNIL